MLVHLLFTQHWSGSLLVIDGVHFWHGMCQSRDQVWLECKLFLLMLFSLGVSWDQPDLNSLTFSTYLFSFLSFCFMLHVLHLIEKNDKILEVFPLFKDVYKMLKEKRKTRKIKKNFEKIDFGTLDVSLKKVYSFFTESTKIWALSV